MEDMILKVYENIKRLKDDKAFYSWSKTILVILWTSYYKSLEFQAFSRLIGSVQLATSLGFTLGIAGPPFNDPKRKNVQK